ncbi:MAG: PPC domain-containing protein, partial [Phycisphaerales bacterium]|nr:PPC domain-containing protein [Phycisphaerales bacterium]
MKLKFALSMLVSAAICPVASLAHTGNEIPVEADGHRSIQPQRPVKPGDEMITFTRRFGIEWLPVDSVILPGMDHKALLKEDEGFDPLPLRFAVPRNFTVDAADGRWVEVPGGWLWRVQVQSNGAENVRGHVSNMDLPKNAEIKIHAPSMPLNIAGPYRETGPQENGEAWGFTAPGDHFIVEYFTPGEPVGQLPFDIDELYHGYRDIFPHDDEEEQPEGGVAGAGSCHNDPACYSDWSDVSDGTCRLYFQGYVCSAQLTATSSADETPLVTTANHCIGSASEAASCEFLFRYRRTNCGSGLSSGVSSNGSVILDTYSASDNTLLMIDDELPSNIFFVGWTTSALSNGTDVVCVHHPAGSYQRISFGDKISSGVCGSSSYWHGVQWNDGVTEGGSSGSALYRESDQKLTSVLTCGASACSNPSGGDGYGRFDRAYTNGGFSAFMQSGSDDSLEDSDTCETALEIEPGTYNNLVVKSTDEDWYTFDVANGTDIDVFLDFIDGNGDIDAQLFDSCGGSYLVNSTSNNNDESFTYTNNTGISQTYYLRVFLYTDTRNEYTM